MHPSAMPAATVPAAPQRSAKRRRLHQYAKAFHRILHFSTHSFAGARTFRALVNKLYLVCVIHFRSDIYKMKKT
jgi:hypothetical protein